ncbi:radical SAM protein [Roseomonas sp. PWR1]|uniref:Radical SAM protein n=1 Tax=Roseomonas nitratireducens TaxID=2820810 RepID=A0ABS4AXQ9_9PROT|nr:radical SAM protein [Neoroseomonas nitratireducens]MBP0466163.1 radical SAM protein [Neoroseomonas nitratireducens]
MACQTRRLRVVQLHPTRRCNLACRHCYSLSGPEARDTLPLDTVLRLVADMKAAGYDGLSLSGGEPLMWPGLLPTLAAARREGLVTALATNGMPLTARRAADLAPLVDLVAVSLDGAPATHDRIRGRDGAFATMRARLPLLRAAGIRFGIIFTVTRHNLDDLAFAANFAMEEGAALLQIHPLEAVGRAAEEMAEEEPDGLVASAAYLAALRLADLVGDRLAVQCDLAHRGLLRDAPWLVLGEEPAPDAPLAAFAPDLIVEADGTVVPVQHGFPRAHALGNLATAPLPELGARWRAAGGPARLRAHVRRALDAATADPDAMPAFDWYRALTEA